MNILIVGGTRFFGHHTATALHEAGHSVSVFTRGKTPIELPGSIQHIKGDRKQDADLRRAAQSKDWDVVWDNMSYTGADAEGAVGAFRDRCRLFIHTSTLAVYSVCDGIVSPYREEDFDAGRERRDRLGVYPYDYGIGRRDGERVLMAAYAENGFPYVTLRLPAVLGPRDYSLRAWSYWRRMLEDRRVILPDGGIEMHRSVYSGDVVAAVLAIMNRGAAIAGRAYNIAGREIVSLRQFVEASAELLDVEVEILGIARAAIEAAGIDVNELSPYSTWGDHLESIAKARHELEFEPTPLDDWLGPTIDWHLEHRRDAEPPGWELRPREKQLADRWNTFLEQLG